MGLKKASLPDPKKSTGHYHLFEFTANDGKAIAELEVTFKRDERILRFMTVALDKHGVAYAERRRTRLKNLKKKKNQFNLNIKKMAENSSEIRYLNPPSVEIKKKNIVALKKPVLSTLTTKTQLSY